MEYFLSILSVKNPNLPGRGQNKLFLQLFYYLEKGATQSTRPLTLTPSSGKQTKKRKRKKEKKKCGHQKMHEYHQALFSHFFHKGYQCTETCTMNVAELSPLWYLCHEFNGEDRTQYSYDSLILKNRLHILEHSFPTTNLKISRFQCRLSHKHRWKRKSTGRCNVQPTHFSSTETYSVESTDSMVELFSPKTKPQFPPDLLHLSGVVNHIFRNDCSTSVFHTCPTMSVSFVSVLLYTPPCMWMTIPYARRSFIAI